MKLPNGYGTVSKLSGNRRRPFMVREGKSGKQKIIDYASSKEEALGILAKYNSHTFEQVQETMTSQELFDKFIGKRKEKLSSATIRSLTSAQRHCLSVMDYNYKDVKAYHMQECIDCCGKGYATKNAIKNLFYHLDRFALELDLCSNQFSSILTTEPTPETTKEVFSEDERQILWENQFSPWVDTILIFLYTGFRISELLEIKKHQVDLKGKTITGGKKTKAGKNRVIPIHSKIFSLMEKRMGTEGDFLISHNGRPLSQSNFRKIWKKLMDNMEMKHTPHECRHTFRSLLDSAGANKVCIDRMMGHKSHGTGERIYTHKTIEELRQNLELVTN
ncbi:MAG: site-specific integrase [Eubacteriales bacterium]